MRSRPNYVTVSAVLATLALLGGSAAIAAAAPDMAPSSGAAAARYVQKPGTGTLTFSFVQAGADTPGSFRQFATGMTWDAKNPAAGRLDVTVQVASLETQDKDRDDTLASADLFDAKKYPTAQFTAGSFEKRPDGGLVAVGKLTLRGVTRDLRLPLTIRENTGGIEISGETTLKRLDFGVGQGEWKSTEWVGDEVKLRYQVPLARAG